MSSLAAPAEAKIQAGGTLPGGGRLIPVDGGYLCETGGGMSLHIEYMEGRDSARIGAGSAGGKITDQRQLALCIDWLFAHHPTVSRILLSAPLEGECGAKKNAVHREDFYQRADLWYCGSNAGRFPEQWLEPESGPRHPRRPQVPAGEVYRRHFHFLGMDFSLRRLDPMLDLERFTDWMNQPRVAEFWEEQGDRDKQRDYIRGVLEDPHKDPLIACFDDRPFAYFELYWALEDRLAPYYDAEPYDRGLHLLVGETDFLGGHYARAWFNGICHFMFLDDSRTERLVGEPRADNAAVLKYVERIPGWCKVKEFDFPHKRAALAMCHREPFFLGLEGL